MAPADDASSQRDSPETSRLATASLTLGVLSVVCYILTGIPALLLGLIALISIYRSKERLRGAWMAWVGIVVSIASFVVLTGGYIRVTEASRRMASSNNLKQLGLAMHSYNDSHYDLPPAYLATKDGKPGLSWRVALVPYIEKGTLYWQFHLDEPWDSPHNMNLLDQMYKTYRSPRDPEGTTDTPYRIFVGPDALFSAEPRGLKERGKYSIESIPDGSSHTLLIAECATKITWTKPEELEYADDKPLPEMGYLSNEYFMVLMCDGSVRAISKKSNTDANLRNMIRPKDGNPVYLD